MSLSYFATCLIQFVLFLKYKLLKYKYKQIKYKLLKYKYKNIKIKI